MRIQTAFLLSLVYVVIYASLKLQFDDLLEVLRLDARWAQCSKAKMRRKGEPKLEKQWWPWGPKHPVVLCMKSGDSWFRAWQTQGGIVLSAIARKTGITFDRLMEMDRGALPSAEEIEKLARLWNCPAADIQASLAGDFPA